MMSMLRPSPQVDGQRTGSFRRIRRRRLLNVTAACLVVALAGLFVGAGLLAHQVQAARDSMALRREIAVRSRELQSVFDLLQDAEAGQRGLLLTGKQSHVAAYASARRELPAMLEQALSASGREGPIAPHVREIGRLADLRLAELAETISLFQAGHRDQALDVVRSGRGEHFMIALRAQMSLALGILASQGAAADARGQTQMVAAKRLAWWTAFSLAMVILLAGLQIRAHNRLRASFEKQVAAQASMLKSVVDEIPASLAILDQNLRYKLINKTFERWRSRPRETVVGKTIAEVMGEEEFERSKPWFERALAGEQVSYEKAYPGRPIGMIAATYSPMFLDDGTVAGVITMAHDITAHRNERDRLQRLSERDSLTGLLNRAAFEIWLAEAGAGGHAHEIALLYIDLDHFKPVNDEFGHPAGDAVLREIAERLRGVVRPTDVVARLGGDEFAIGLTHIKQLADAQQVAAKVVAEARRPFHLENGVVHIGASVGVAVDASVESGGGKALLARADQMLYQAKKAGRDRFQTCRISA
jgi:diguanylate cyclase (GGDEF)-like protein/PAS domain S-box-containing protein